MRLCVFALILAALSSPAANVLFDLKDVAAGAVSNRTLYLTPVSFPLSNGTYTVTGDRRTYKSGADGTVTVSNLLSSTLLCQVAGPWTNTHFLILVPSDSATYNANALLVSTITVPGSDVAYSQTASDARFVHSTSPVLYSPLLLTNPNLGDAAGTLPATLFVNVGSTIDLYHGGRILLEGSASSAAQIYLSTTNSYLRCNTGAGIYDLFNSRQWLFDGIMAGGPILTNNVAVLSDTTNIPGTLFLWGTTNSVRFGATNNPPANASTIVKWISVQVAGETNAYRLPLYQ